GGCNYRLDAIGGFRFLHLDEDLGIMENLTVVGAGTRFGLLPGDRAIVVDTFATRNNFYGGQLGVDGEYRFQKFFVGGQFKLALGVMHQVVDINGATVLLPVGLPAQVGRGGLLAAPSNMGHFDADRFAVIPEVGVKVGYQVTE